MNKLAIFKNLCLALAGLVFSVSVQAHGGAAGTDTDQCKFELEPGHWLHYTAYQSEIYPAQDFCGKLPALNTLTQLVFDYQDMRYRDMAVEFEVTKEPEGTRVFFEEAKKHKSGTVALSLPKGVAEQGKYLIHITLLKNDGERLDAHMGFTAGAGESISYSAYGLYALFAFAGLYVLYLSSAGFKRQVDSSLEKIKA